MLDAIMRFAAFLLGVVLVAGVLSGQDQAGAIFGLLNIVGALVGAAVAWVGERRRGRRVTRLRGAVAILIGAFAFGLIPVILALFGGQPASRLATLLGMSIGTSAVLGPFLSVFAVALCAKASKRVDGQPTAAGPPM